MAVCVHVHNDADPREIYVIREVSKKLEKYGLFLLQKLSSASAQAVTSKWQLRTVYESIQKVPTGKTTEILVPSQPSIRFFPPMAQNGPFWPFFGP